MANAEKHTLRREENGEAKICRGYKLTARYVIHTVGPVWQGGHKNEELLLERDYQSSLRLAAEHKIKRIAFPSTSAGIYRLPHRKGQQGHIQNHPGLPARTHIS